MGCNCGGNKRFSGGNPSVGARASGQLPNVVTSSPAGKSGPAANTIRSAPTPTFRAGQNGVVRGRV